MLFDSYRSFASNIGNHGLTKHIESLGYRSVSRRHGGSNTRGSHCLSVDLKSSTKHSFPRMFCSNRTVSTCSSDERTRNFLTIVLFSFSSYLWKLAGRLVNLQTQMFRQTDVIPRFITSNDYFRNRTSERKSLLTNIGDATGNSHPRLSYEYSCRGL
jgi:hypothetical protein